MGDTLCSRWAALAKERGCFTECKSDSRRGQPQRSCGVSLDWCQSLVASMRVLLRDDASVSTESIVQKLFVPFLGFGARREQRWVLLSSVHGGKSDHMGDCSSMYANYAPIRVNL